MALGLKRKGLQANAELKLADATLLLEHKRWSNAYYLAGYAVEIGLKSCISRQVIAESIPDRNFINAIYKHELRSLVGVAGLTRELKERETKDSAFAANWALVAEWTPEVRYTSVDMYSAQLMLQAITDKTTGVFEWIKIYW